MATHDILLPYTLPAINAGIFLLSQHCVKGKVVLTRG